MHKSKIIVNKYEKDDDSNSNSLSSSNCAVYSNYDE